MANTLILNMTDGTSLLFADRELAEDYFNKQLSSKQEKLENGCDKYEFVSVEQTPSRAECELVLWSLSEDGEFAFSTELTDDLLTNQELVSTSKEYPVKYMFAEDYETDVVAHVDRDINTNNIEGALQVLKDNGIEEDECDTVLQAIGYTLLDTELFPEE